MLKLHFSQDFATNFGRNWNAVSSTPVPWGSLGKLGNLERWEGGGGGGRMVGDIWLYSAQPPLCSDIAHPAVSTLLETI